MFGEFGKILAGIKSNHFLNSAQMIFCVLGDDFIILNAPSID